MKTNHLPKIKCAACNGEGKVPELSAIGRGRREAREAVGVKATPLAKKMGIPKSTLWDLETGRRGEWTDTLFDAHVAGVKELAEAIAAKAKAKKAKKAVRVPAAKKPTPHDPTLRTKSGQPKRNRTAKKTKGFVGMSLDKLPARPGGKVGKMRARAKK